MLRRGLTSPNLWRERKESYLAHLATVPLEVRRVAAADKLHNARAILADYRRLGEWLWRRFNRATPANTHLTSTSVRAVWVNGVPIYDGAPTRAFPGGSSVVVPHGT